MLCHDQTASPVGVIWPCIVIWPLSLASEPQTSPCQALYWALFYNPAIFHSLGCDEYGQKDFFIFTFLQNIFRHIL